MPPFPARQVADRTINTSDNFGKLIKLKKSGRNFQVRASAGFVAPECLAPAEADEFTRQSSLHLTSRNTETRAKEQLHGVIKDFARKSTEKDLIQIAKDTNSVLFSPTGEQCTIKNWHAFTDLGGHHGLWLAVKVNKLADAGRISEEQRIYYLCKLQIVPYHRQLWKLPKDCIRYPGNSYYKWVSGKSVAMTQAERAAYDASPFGIKMADHRAKIQAYQEANKSYFDEDHKILIGASWPVEVHGIDAMEVLGDISKVRDENLTARQLAHIVDRAIVFKVGDVARADVLNKLSVLFAEMAAGGYQAPIIRDSEEVEGDMEMGEAGEEGEDGSE